MTFPEAEIILLGETLQNSKGLLEARPRCQVRPQLVTPTHCNSPAPAKGWTLCPGISHHHWQLMSAFSVLQMLLCLAEPGSHGEQRRLKTIALQPPQCGKVEGRGYIGWLPVPAMTTYQSQTGVGHVGTSVDKNGDQIIFKVVLIWFCL